MTEGGAVTVKSRSGLTTGHPAWNLRVFGLYVHVRLSINGHGSASCSLLSYHTPGSRDPKSSSRSGPAGIQLLPSSGLVQKMGKDRVFKPNQNLSASSFAGCFAQEFRLANLVRTTRRITAGKTTGKLAVSHYHYHYS